MTRARRNIWTWLATSFSIGYIPFAPGTWGSLPGVALGAGIMVFCRDVTAPYPLWAFYSLGLAIAVVLTAFAWVVIDRTERFWHVHDDRRIVIDEVVGQAIALSFVPPTWLNLLIGFLLFRLLDIWKPWFIGAADRDLPGALGTLLDDVLAGAVAALFLGLGHWYFVGAL